MVIVSHRRSRPKFRSSDDCPDRDKHTPSPSDYTGWFEWAERMGKTHAQRRCPTCGFLTMWVPRGSE